MTILSPGFILLAAIMGIAWILSFPKTKRIREIEQGLTADEFKTFHDTYLRSKDRNGIPPKFEELFSLKKLMSRLWIITTLAVLGCFIAIILLGTDLGLQIGDNP